MIPRLRDRVLGVLRDAPQLRRGRVVRGEPPRAADGEPPAGAGAAFRVLWKPPRARERPVRQNLRRVGDDERRRRPNPRARDRPRAERTRAERMIRRREGIRSFEIRPRNLVRVERPSKGERGGGEERKDDGRERRRAGGGFPKRPRRPRGECAERRRHGKLEKRRRQHLAVRERRAAHAEHQRRDRVVPPAVPVETPVRPERDGEEGDAGRGGDGAARRRRERERGEAKPLRSPRHRRVRVVRGEGHEREVQRRGDEHDGGDRGVERLGPRGVEIARAREETREGEKKQRVRRGALAVRDVRANLREARAAPRDRARQRREARRAEDRVRGAQRGVRGAEGGDGDVRLAHRRGVGDAAPDERRDVVATQRRDE